MYRHLLVLHSRLRLCPLAGGDGLLMPATIALAAWCWLRKRGACQQPVPLRAQTCGAAALARRQLHPAGRGESTPHQTRPTRQLRYRLPRRRLPDSIPPPVATALSWAYPPPSIVIASALPTWCASRIAVKRAEQQHAATADIG